MKVIEITLVSLALFISACNESKRDTTKEQADFLNSRKFKAEDLNEDAKFIVSTYETGLFSIKASQLADSISNNKDVKKIAKKINDNFITINGKVADIAALRNVNLPDSLSIEHKNTFYKLQSSKEFDWDYLVEMHKANELLLKSYESTISVTLDTALINLISETNQLIQANIQETGVSLTNLNKNKLLSD